jgi:hypothetical protein
MASSTQHSQTKLFALDEKNGNSLWQDAIAKEMKNVMVAFEVRIRRNRRTDGRYLIMIFTIKMDYKEGPLGSGRTHDQTT